MSRRIDLPELDELVRRLPFRLDAVDEVGERFARWRRDPNEGDAWVVALWTYCYVRRYYLVRFAREPSFTGAELEEVIERAYRRIEHGKLELNQPLRYPRWVIVICRNTYLNFVSRRRVSVPVDCIAEPVDDSSPLDSLHDTAGLVTVLRAAVDRLPPFLRIFAALRFIEGLDYAGMAERTGKDVATVRAYTHRALTRLRRDRRFMSWIHDRTGYESPEAGSFEESGGPG